MLCEGRLLRMTFGESYESDSLPPPPPPPPARPLQNLNTAGSLRTGDAHLRSPPEWIGGPDDAGPPVGLCDSPLRSCSLYRSHPSRHLSPEIRIPTQAGSGLRDSAPFLVPSSCRSLCQNYSDLHIGGDQVLPLWVDPGPVLYSRDVPEDSLQGQAAPGGLLAPLRGGSNRWRQRSNRDWSVLLQGREGPCSNSLLNRYLEQKLLDLYQQYTMDNMARHEPDQCPACPLLGSELVLTSLDHLTMKLSREGNLETNVAKDMVLSCLLRVAGDFQSSEISTPQLQISGETAGSEQEREQDGTGPGFRLRHLV